MQPNSPDQPPPLLELRDVRVSYGAIDAVNGVSLRVRAGEIVTLIGANGAGKTTLLRTISALLKPRGGEILYDGKSITGLPPHEIVRRGLCHVPEGRMVFANLTVEENLRMGAYLQTDRGVIERELEFVFATFPRLKERLPQLAGTLSGGEQQMLAIGRALMLNPTLLLMDEPSEGLAPAIVENLAKSLLELVKTGQRILLIEQNLKFATMLSESIVVLSNGEIQAKVSSKDLLSSAELQNKYLGVA